MTYPILFSNPEKRAEAQIIYGLTDPKEPDRIRYVGRTNNAGGGGIAST
jgi:hypothetical protein